MLKMVDGTGIIGVDMVCPLGGAVSPPQPPNFDKVEMEGVGSLMLPNSLKAPLERVELIGNSVQLTTTGKNLLNIPFIDGSTRETPIQCNFENPILIHAETLPKSIQENIWRIKVVYKDNTLKYVVDSDMQKGSLFIASPENPIVSINYRGLYITEGQYEKIQVEHGAKSTPYEPYTGLKPSPSPEYPQEIESAGKFDEASGKYLLDVKVTGKNLFNAEKARDITNWIIRDGDGYAKFPIYVKKGNKVTFSYTEKLTAGKGFYLGIAQSDTGSDVGWLYHSTEINLNNNKFTIVAQGNCLYLSCNKSSIQKFFDAIQTLQVEISDGQTPYEPYTEQALTLISDRPLTKWDRLVEQGGQYGWLYQSEVKEYRGENSVSLYDSGFYFLLNNKNITKGEGYCSELKQHVPYEKNPCISFNIASNTYAYALNTQEIYGSSVSEIKEYLKIHPLHLVYKTETTEFVPLPQSEQTQLRNLHSYNGTTNITVDSGEVPCGIKLTYRKEI